MKKDQTLYLASAVALALTGAATGEAVAAKGKCFGVAKSGQNHCGGDGNTCKGGVTGADYQAHAWVLTSQEGCKNKHLAIHDNGDFHWEAK
ncbi:MAG: DUF2282 domain-containing protein [bacterium]|nr:DUF2282 domain-containing protein [bacterium]